MERVGGKFSPGLQPQPRHTRLMQTCRADEECFSLSTTRLCQHRLTRGSRGFAPNNSLLGLYSRLRQLHGRSQCQIPSSQAGSHPLTAISINTFKSAKAQQPNLGTHFISVSPYTKLESYHKLTCNRPRRPAQPPPLHNQCAL